MSLSPSLSQLSLGHPGHKLISTRMGFCKLETERGVMRKKRVQQGENRLLQGKNSKQTELQWHPC